MTNFSQTPIKELAGIIARQLEADGIEVVLVGGLAVEFYSKNIYLTKDIDMVNINYQAPAIIGETMAKLGFYKKGSIYKNTSTKITVEFPSAPLFVGDKLIKETTFITIGEYKIPILNRVDVVKDRLSAYFHWKDRPALAQALTVMTCHQINPVDIKSFCIKISAASEPSFKTTPTGEPGFHYYQVLVTDFGHNSLWFSHLHFRWFQQ
ncbi:MAG TPA: hypothetical protein ENJ60_04100, partial [Aeromonadales bacterium]|nr:hypothetical protein [Aeromonadales bacterium]